MSVGGAAGQVNVLTQHNDPARTGQNVNETILTPANVSSGNFGKLFTLSVDGQVYAQPLFMGGLQIAGAQHDVVFVETEHDSVYAFDADQGGTPIWQVSLLDSAHGAAAGATTVPYTDTGCGNINPEYGITSTPVIDPTTNTMYVVGETYENAYAVYRIHALDIYTGAEKFGGPTQIQASVSGTGNGSSNGVLTFDPKWLLQRNGLALVNGQVYVAFGSHCDFGAYHGWLLGYSASTLAQTSVFQPTPNGLQGGFWNGGTAPSSDTLNGVSRLFVVTGNGSYDATSPYGTNNMDYADDVIQLTLTSGMQVGDAFTPMNQAQRQLGDYDLGSGGVVVLPDQPGTYPHLLAQYGKESTLYLLNRDNLGGYSTTADNVLQSVTVPAGLGVWGDLAYWNGYVYAGTAEGPLYQYALSNGALSLQSSSSQILPWQGATPSISSNGTSNGILWLITIDATLKEETLLAYDATNVQNLLYSSATNASRDTAGTGVRFPVPTVANGEVFVGADSQVAVYGMIPVQPDFSISASAPTVSVSQGASASDTISVTPINNFSGTVSLSASNLPTGTTVAFTASSATSISVQFNSSASAALGSFPVTITAVSGALTHSLVLNVIVSVQFGTPVVSINAGGAAAGTWAADEYYSGGAASSTSATINTTLVPNAAPESVYQSERNGNATYTIPNLTPGSSYAVNLHFAETFWNAAGSRLFNVAINGTQVLTNFDVFATAGGKNIAVLKSFTASASSSGTITIAFTTGAADAPVINGIQILSPNVTPAFTLSTSSASVTVGQGSSATSTISVVPAGGFTGSVTLAATGLPSGVTSSFATNPTSASSVLTLSASGTATAGTANINITGTSGSLTSSIPIALTVSGPPSYTLAASPSSLSIAQGSQGSTTISVVDMGGFTGGVTLTATGLPSGVTASFATNATTSSSLLTLTASSTAATGTSTINITGTSGSLTSSTPVSLTIAAAGQAVVSINAGGAAAGTWSADEYYSGGATSSTSATINTSLLANPAPQSVYQTERDGTYTYTIPNLTAGSSYTVNLHFAETFWSAPGSRLFNVAINGTQVLTNFDIFATAGGKNIAVMESFTATATEAGTIVIAFTNGAADLPKIDGIQILSGATAPSFTLSTTSTSLTVGQSNTASSTISVVPAGGFTGNVTLAATGLPSGVTASFGTNPTTGSSLLTLTASSTATIGTSTITITGTSGSLTASTPVSVTVTGLSSSYTLSASPTSLSIAQGTQGSTTISVVDTGGFTGNVTLAATGLPSGVTASFATNPTTGSSLLTLTATSTAAIGTANITITGTSGSLTASTPFALTVSAPGQASTPVVSINAGGAATGTWSADEYYSGGGAASTSATINTSLLANPAPQSVYQTERNGTSTYTIPNLTAGSNYTVNLHFAETFWSAPGDRLFNVSINGTQVLTNFDIFATAGGKNIAVMESFTATATEAGTIVIAFTNGAADLPKIDGIQILSGATAPSFTLSSTSTSLTVGQSNTASSTISVVPAGGFTGNVTLAATGLPSGVTASFATNPTTGSSLLTLTASSTATIGTSTITITGTSGSLTASTPVSVTVTGLSSSYTLSASPTSLSIAQGTQGPTTISVVDTGGFTGNVTLAATGLPSGVTASFATNPTSGSSLLTLTASSTAAIGTANITITGTSGSLTASTPFALTVSAPGQASTPVVSINAGGAATGTWSADEYYSGGGAASTTATINTSLLANPAPQSVYQTERNGTSTYTIPNLTAGSNYTVNLHFAETFWSAPGDRLFNVSINGTQVLTNFDIFATAGGKNIAVMESFTATATEAGTIVIAFTNGAADLPKIDGIQILSGATAPSFTLSSTSTSLTVGQSNTASSTISVVPAGGFTGNVTLAATGLPSGVTASFATNPTTGSSLLTLTASSTATIGTSTITITGTSGSLTASTPVSVTVSAASSYTLSASPTSLSIAQGTQGPTTISVVDTGGFTGNVTLAATGLPSGVTASFATNPTTGSSLLTLTATSTAAIGTANITITGTSGSLTASTPFALTVSAPGQASTPVVSINAGGAATGTWSADEYYSGGGAASTSATINTSLLANPAPQSVYQTERNGTSTYTIPNLTAGSNYTVNLHFAETFWSAPGDRLFNVSINGMQVLTNFDIFATAGGKNIAVMESFTATATEAGTIVIAFTNGAADLPKIDGIQILSGATAPSFTLSSTSTSLTVGQSNTASSTISVVPAGGFTGNVTLAATGLPSGVTASFATNPTTGSSLLTLTASSTATIGTSTITITGTSGSLTASTPVSVTVSAASSYTLSALLTSVSVAQGSQGSSTVSVVPAGGFTGNVTLAATGLPSGVTASFATNPTTGSSLLTLTATSTAAIGTANITITGTSGSLTSSTPIAVTVSPPPSYTLTASLPSLTVAQGSQGSSTISVVPGAGFT